MSRLSTEENRPRHLSPDEVHKEEVGEFVISLLSIPLIHLGPGVGHHQVLLCRTNGCNLDVPTHPSPIASHQLTGHDHFYHEVPLCAGFVLLSMKHFLLLTRATSTRWCP